MLGRLPHSRLIPCPSCLQVVSPSVLPADKRTKARPVASSRKNVTEEHRLDARLQHNLNASSQTMRRGSLARLAKRSLTRWRNGGYHDRVSLHAPAGGQLSVRRKTWPGGSEKRCSVIADRPMQRQACLRARGCGRGGGYISLTPDYIPPCRTAAPSTWRPGSMRARRGCCCFFVPSFP